MCLYQNYILLNCISQIQIDLLALTPLDSNDGKLNESMGPIASKNPIGDFQGESKLLLLEDLPTKLSMVVLEILNKRKICLL
jgi:hypothetical protein